MLYNYYNTILNPPFSKVLKCEGIVLNDHLSYHITNKNTPDELRRIRGNTIQISDNDILLHYRDRDMEKITPSYWGTLFYDNEWKFRLDASFTSHPNQKGNFHLPFLRYVKRQKGEFIFVPSSGTLNESGLSRKLLFNTPFGDKATRYYLQILKINGRKVLSWYDDGIKQSYPINKSKSDTISIIFEKNANQIIPKKQYTFFFNNTTSQNGEYELICYSDRPTELVNMQTASKKKIRNRYFQINEIMFSINPRYSLLNRALLTSYVLILLFSFVFLILKLADNILEGNSNPMSISLTIYRLCLLCFLSLGFPIIVMAFEYQNFTLIRKFLLAIVVPSIPFSTLFYRKIRYWIFNCAHDLLSDNLKKRIRSFYKTIKKGTSNQLFIPIVLIPFLILAFLPILRASNERVLGIPTMHYIKIILLILFAIIYFDKFVHIFSFLQRVLPQWLKGFTTSLFLILFAICITILTKDWGTLLFIALTVLSFDVIYGKFPITIGKRKIRLWAILFLYLFIIAGFLVSGKYLELGRKSYRITYTLSNPSSDFYKNANEGDRESIAILYQNLNILKEHPLGVKNLSIPKESRSVAHTDFAVHWSLMNNGLLFLMALLFVFSLFIYCSLFILKLLILKTKETRESLISSSDYIKAFLGFILVMIIVQCCVPLTSNLLLPGAFLSGVPFIGISISLGDALIICVLLIMLDLCGSKYKYDMDESLEKKFIKHINDFSFKTTVKLIAVLVAWIGFKILLVSCKSSSESTWNIKKEIKTNFNFIPNTNDKRTLIIFLDSIFQDKNKEKLSPSEKNIGKVINLKYYTGKETELFLKEKTRFSIRKREQLKRISLDSLLAFNQKQISGKNWKGEPVYLREHYVNGSIQWIASSPYYYNIDIYNEHLNRDVSATINEKIDNYLIDELNNYKNKLKVSVLVSRNKDGKIILNSAYPFNNKAPEIEYSFFPGSIKKGLLAAYVCEKNKNLLDSITPLGNKKHGIIRRDWIRLSDNEATLYISKNINTIKFSDYLSSEFNLPFYSLYLNGYAEHTPVSFDHLSVSERRSVIIGGTLKYNPITINEWYQHIFDVSRRNTNLFEIMHSPFLLNGTAYSVGIKLKNEGVNIDNLICKTGTLQAPNSKLNLSTGFVIAGKKNTITVLMDGLQPKNIEQKAAKNLFIVLIDELKPFIE